MADPAEKAKLGRQHQADLVDMEFAVVARACRERDVPCGCVRVVSDDWQMPLSPRLLDVLAGGRISPWRLTTAVARSPRLMGEFWQLARDTRRAADQLGLALGELLTLTLPWASEDGGKQNRG